MIVGLRRSLGITLLLAVVLPSFGPLADHHFAERQAVHQHLGPSWSNPHFHDYRQAHHHHGPDAWRDDDAPAALYSFESGLAPYLAVDGAASLLSALHPELAGLVVPAPHRGLTRSSYPAPPKPPPRTSA